MPAVMHLIFAPNVRAGGGSILLRSLVYAWSGKPLVTVVLDDRVNGTFDVPNGMNVRWVRHTLVGRLLEELRLRSAVKQGANVLCFHGVPPLFISRKFRSRVTLFIQNKLLVQSSSTLWSFPIKAHLRLRVERAILRLRLNCTCEVFVQTPSMKREVLRFSAGLLDESTVRILPFGSNLTKATSVDGRRFDFIYPASGEPHKNHACLIDAWVELKKNGFRPSLALTLGESDGKLWRDIQALSNRVGLDVTNLGNLSYDQMSGVYASADALIYPSVSESLGLPLLEATKCGVPIIASELDYVRDICSPVQTFDPRSAVSIARAILRFSQGIEELIPIQQPSAFWEALSARSK